MFNIKLEEKSYKMTFKGLPVKMQRSKNRQRWRGHTCVLRPGADRVKLHERLLRLVYDDSQLTFGELFKKTS